MTTRAAHYHSAYNRNWEAWVAEQNAKDYKAALEKTWLALMDEIEAILGPEEYEKFYDSLPDTAPTQAYIDICNTKLAELAAEPVYCDLPCFS